MKKSLLILATLSALAGCASQNQTSELMNADPAHYFANGSELLSIDHLEVDKGTFVALMKYLDDQDKLCFQWVSSAIRTLNKTTNESSVETTISVHCGKYEVREVSNPLLGSTQNEYFPTDIKAVNEFKNSDGLTVQSIEI